MRIVFDDQIFGWQPHGGITRYVVELSKRLSKYNALDVSVVAPLHFNEYLKASTGMVDLFGCYVDAPVLFRHLIRKINPLVTKLVIGRTQPDIIHSTYYFSSRNRSAASKTVVTVHDMIHEKFPESFASGNPTSRLKAEAVKRAHHVICVSENTRRDLLELVNVSPEKTSVIHHGYTTGNHTLRDQIKPSNTLAPYLFFVGSRDGYKNFSALLRAYASSPLLRGELLLICFGGGSFTSAEKAIIANLGLSEFQVRQISGDDQTLAAGYRNATAFVCPSKYEGFGIPLLEAMNFGCPVVCSHVSSIPEVVGNAGEYFSPYDLCSMMEAIHRVVLNASRREELIALGRNRLNHFSWEKCAQETYDVYRAIV